MHKHSSLHDLVPLVTINESAIVANYLHLVHAVMRKFNHNNYYTLNHVCVISSQCYHALDVVMFWLCFN